MNIRHSGVITLIAGMILMVILGSIHAFSIFLVPLETKFSITRSLTSATYSIALVCLTISVLFGHHIFSRFKPASIALMLCLIAAVGCVAAAYSSSIFAVWAFYGIIFGSANGIGYALSLQTASQANPENKGLAVGIVTACYGLGAAIAPVIFTQAMISGGFYTAMQWLAAILVIAGVVVMALFKTANSRLSVSVPQQQSSTRPDRVIIAMLWLCYGSAVFAGLMIIGHAAGILNTLTDNPVFIIMAPVTVAICNMVGSLSGGYLADRISIKHLLLILPLLSAATLFSLLIVNSPITTILGLSVVGFTYGAIISVYPVTITNIFGQAIGVFAYGRVFTAWGAAGLLGPMLAGMLFEQNNNYSLAITLAAISGMLSVIFVIVLSSKEKNAL